MLLETLNLTENFNIHYLPILIILLQEVGASDSDGKLRSQIDGSGTSEVCKMPLAY